MNEIETIKSESNQNNEFSLSKSIRRFPHPYGRRRLYTTNLPQELVVFAKDYDLLMTYKLAGQPITLTYENGLLMSANICNDGSTGYDVTEMLRSLQDVPVQIPDTDICEIQGTLVISWQAYHELMETGKYNKKDNSPWKLIRQLILSLEPQDLAAIEADFIVYDIGGTTEYEKKSEILERLQTLGFQVIDYLSIKEELTIIQVDDLQAKYTPYHTKYPVSGLVFETDHLFFNCFDPNARRIIGLAWPYDVMSSKFIGIRHLLADLKSL